MSEMGPPASLAGGGGSALGGLGAFMANPWLGLGMQVLSGLMGGQNAQQGIDHLSQMSQSNPFSGFIQGAGSFNLNPNGPSQAMMDPQMAALMGMQGGMLPGLFSGGPFMGQITGSGVDLAGAMGQSDSALQQQANPFYNQANFANNMANVSQLGNMFTGNVAQGGSQRVQDMFSQGFGALNRAGDVGGLIQSNLDASRSLAAPEESRIANNYFDREFMNTRGATTGSQDRRFTEATSAQMRDQQRVMQAQQLGMTEQGMMQQLGMGLLGQGQAGFGQEIGAAQGFAGLGASLENQGFMQGIQALQQNQSAGMQRVQQALGVLGMGQDMFGQGVGLGNQMFANMADYGLGFAGLVPSLLNADAARIGAQGYYAQPMAELYGDKGSFLGGIFG